MVFDFDKERLGFVHCYEYTAQYINASEATFSADVIFSYALEGKNGYRGIQPLSMVMWLRAIIQHACIA